MTPLTTEYRQRKPSRSRSRLMGRVRRSGTAPELHLRSAIHRRGVRFRLGSHGLPGSPDLVFRGARVAIFVDGCFWHGCEEHGTMPKTNTAFWRAKIQNNKRRDRRVDTELQQQGWRVVRLWEHQLHRDLSSTIRRIERLLAKKP
jgi:DNA mismatch endonuclease (patch repair protein)